MDGMSPYYGPYLTAHIHPKYDQNSLSHVDVPEHIHMPNEPCALIKTHLLS